MAARETNLWRISPPSSDEHTVHVVYSTLFSDKLDHALGALGRLPGSPIRPLTMATGQEHTSVKLKDLRCATFQQLLNLPSTRQGADMINCTTANMFAAKTVCFIIAAVLSVSPCWADEDLPAKAEKDAVAPYSYAIGLEIGTSFHADGVELDIESFVQGIKDGLARAKPKYDQETLTEALRQFSEARSGSMVDQNKKFLEENKKAKGVVTLPSGLQYKVIRSGNGPSPTAEDTVRTHYEGRFIDGSVFDSSYRRNQPAEFPVSGVIPGWTEALQKMQVGDKWQLFVPSDLAYGEAGFQGAIPPHATLIFDIELLEVLPAKE